MTLAVNEHREGRLATPPRRKGRILERRRLDAAGNVLSATYGNGVVVTNTYNDPTGRITGINSVNGSGTTIQNNAYSWYRVGNLHTRQWQATDPTTSTVYNPLETFGYDVLNRLNTATLSGTNGGDGTVTTSYDVLGDIVCKSDVTASTCSPSAPGYTYGQGGEYPHAVTAVAGTVNGIANPSYHYDDVGNMDGRAGTQVMWNSLNLPTCMDMTGSSCAGTSYSKFSYAPDKHRYQQVTVDSSGNPETTVYAGGVEFLTTGTTTVARHMLSAYGENVLSINIGDSVCTTTTESICFNYLNSDHLGGVDAVTDVSGNAPKDSSGNPLAVSFGYNAFGGRRDPVTGMAPTAAQVQADRALTHRGFTKHEMLDNLNLIHMNGRVYDPSLGRFLSVDPVYQFPTNMQSLNPYSYVLNNPLSLTDPSGYASECTQLHSCSTDTGTHIPGHDTGVKGKDLAAMQKAQGARFIAKLAGAIQKYAGEIQKAFGVAASSLGLGMVNGQAALLSNGQTNQEQDASSTLNSSKPQAGGEALGAPRHISAHPDGTDGPTITFNNDVPGGPSADKPVNGRLATVIETAVTTTGYSININSTTGGHAANDPHTQMRAVDIDMINGMRVGDIRAQPLVENFMKAVEKFSWVNQVIGPSPGLSHNFVDGVIDRNRPISNSLLLEHMTHIHVNVPRRAFDENP